MNKFNNKKLSITLKTLGVLSLSASSIFFSSGGFISQKPKTINILENHNINENINIENKSSNESTPLSLTNSQFFFTPFSFLRADKDVFTEDYDPNAVEQWKWIWTNLQKPEYAVFKEVKSYIYIMTIVDELIKTEGMLKIKQSLSKVIGGEDLWNRFKEDLGWKSFADIVGTQEKLNENLKILSGYVSGDSDSHKIFELSNKANKANIDFSKQAESTIINPLSGEYKTVIKIATFTPANIVTKSGNIKLNFKFIRDTFSTVSGSLIIRNLSINPDTSLVDNLNNLEIFGRWEMGNKEVIGPQFPQFLGNFVLSQDPLTKEISIIARLKDKEILSNINFDSNFGNESIGNFGIIQEQLTDSAVIFDASDTINVVQEIQFFSNFISQTPATPTDVSSVNKNINGKLTYYLGNDTNFNLNLFYKTQAGILKELFDFEDDEVSKTKKQFLTLGIDDKDTPLDISTKKIEFSEEVISEMGPNISNVENGSVAIKTIGNHNKSALFQQNIYFNSSVSGFSILGTPAFNYPNNLSIRLPNLSQKIFFEKPKSYIEDTVNPQITSEAVAVVRSTRENIAINALAEYYNNWSNSEISNWNTSLSLNQINYSIENSIYKNISWKSEEKKYIGSELYKIIVDEFVFYDKIITQLTGTSLGSNVFQVGGTEGTAIDIVSNQLLSIENGDQRTIIINSVDKIIKDTTLLPSNKAFLIQDELVKLIQIKFSEMKNKYFDQRVNGFYYDQIKLYLNAEVVGDKRKLNNVSEYLEFDSAEKLFNIIGSNILVNSETLTGSEKMNSLFNLLYFGSGKTYFGSSLFSALSTLGGSESTLDLFNRFFGDNNKKLLWEFDSQNLDIISNSINVYDRMLSVFGFGINDITEKSKISGEKLKLQWGNDDFSTVIDKIFQQFNSNVTQKVQILDKQYNYNTLNLLTTTTNIYNSLLYRMENTPEGVDPKEDNEMIEKLLTSGINSLESIFVWSRIQKVGNDINLYTEYFSLKTFETKRLSNEIKTDKTILSRIIDEQEALLIINPFIDVQTIWPILIGLISVGMIIISSISLVGIRKNYNLSSPKVIKTILIITLLISVALLGLISGFAIPNLF